MSNKGPIQLFEKKLSILPFFRAKTTPPPTTLPPKLTTLPLKRQLALPFEPLVMPTHQRLPTK